MHQRPLAIPAPDRVVQEHDAGRGDKVHHHAGVHRKGAVDEQECAAQQGRDHPSSVHEGVSVRRLTCAPKKNGDVHARECRRDATRRAAHLGAEDLGRPSSQDRDETTPFSHAISESRTQVRKRRLPIQHRIHRLPRP